MSSQRGRGGGRLSNSAGPAKFRPNLAAAGKREEKAQSSENNKAKPQNNNARGRGGSPNRGRGRGRGRARGRGAAWQNDVSMKVVEGESVFSGADRARYSNSTSSVGTT